MYKILSAGLLLLVIAVSARAEDGQGQEIQAAFGEDSFRFIYVSEAWGQEIGTLDVHMSLMTTGSSGDLVNLGILVKRQDFNSPIKFLIGTQLYYSNIANSNAAALALGGEVLITPPSFSGIGFGFSYYLAPQATSFSDAEELNEYSVSISYMLTAKSILSFGYQSVTVKLVGEGSSRDIEDGYYIGIRLEF